VLLSIARFANQEGRSKANKLKDSSGYSPFRAGNQA